MMQNNNIFLQTKFELWSQNDKARSHWLRERGLWDKVWD